MRTWSIPSGLFVVGAASVFIGCGSDPAAITFDSTTSSTTTSIGAAATSTAAGVTDGAPASSAPESLSAASTAVSASVSSTVGGGDVIGDSWTVATGNLAGLDSECGNLTLVSARPDQNVVIAGVAIQGLWASEDGGGTWTQLGQGEGSDVITNRATSIVYDPEVPSRFWESGAYSGGAYRTDDDGVTFQQLGDVIHFDAISVDFTDPERRTLLVTVHESSMALRSTDGGVTWVDVSAGLPEGVGYAGSPFVVDAQIHLLGTNSGGASGIFRTTDGGTTWTRVYDGAVAGPVVRTSNGDLFWKLAGSANLIVSTDGGMTWALHGRGGIARNATALIEMPDGRFATFGDSHVIVSDDYGETWREIGPPLPYTPIGLTYSDSGDAFYVWRFTCGDGDDVVAPDAIMRLEFASGLD